VKFTGLVSLAFREMLSHGFRVNEIAIAMHAAVEQVAKRIEREVGQHKSVEQEKP
jgi:hypothetical protein